MVSQAGYCSTGQAVTSCARKGHSVPLPGEPVRRWPGPGESLCVPVETCPDDPPAHVAVGSPLAGDLVHDVEPVARQAVTGVSLPRAAAVLDLHPDIVLRVDLDAHSEPSAGLAAAGMEDRVGRELRYAQDSIVTHRAAFQEPGCKRPSPGDVAGLAGKRLAA